MNAPTHPVNPAEIETVPVDPTVVATLQAQAAHHLRSALTIAGWDPEGAFALAYDAARKVALATCAAAGIRPRGTAHHEVTFDAALRVVQARCSRVEAARIKRSLDAATDLRRVRGGAEYRGEVVTPADLRDSIEVAEEVASELSPVIDRLIA